MSDQNPCRRETDPHLIALIDRVGTLCGKVDGLCEKISDMDDRHTERLNNHTDRLGKVERRQSWFSGGLAALSSVGFLGLVAAWWDKISPTQP